MTEHPWYGPQSRGGLADEIVAFVIEGKLYLGAKTIGSALALIDLFGHQTWPRTLSAIPVCPTGIEVDLTQTSLELPEERELIHPTNPTKATP